MIDYKTILILLLGISLFSCDQDSLGKETAPSLSVPEGDLELIKDGLVVPLKNMFATMHSDNRSGKSLTRLSIDIKIEEGGVFILNIENWQWQNPPINGIIEKTYDTDGNPGPNTECLVIDTSQYCDSGLGIYGLTTGNFTSKFTKNNQAGNITISSIDPIKQTVSGHFDLVLSSTKEDGEQYGFKGQFNSLAYF